MGGCAGSGISKGLRSRSVAPSDLLFVWVNTHAAAYRSDLTGRSGRRIVLGHVPVSPSLTLLFSTWEKWRNSIQRRGLKLFPNFFFFFFFEEC